MNEEITEVQTEALKRRATAIVATVNRRVGYKLYRTTDITLILSWSGSPLAPLWTARLGATPFNSAAVTPEEALDKLTRFLSLRHDVDEAAFDLETTDG
jgi:hypothetical protein